MKISKQELINYVNSNIAKMLTQEDYEVNIVNPHSFLNSKRIDILIKYLYVNSLINGKGIDFHRRLYLNHIKAFNGFVEADDTNKIGPNDFDNNIKSLLSAIRNNGFDDNYIIPVDRSCFPLDGAHRISIAIALGIEIKSFNVGGISPLCFDLSFFQNRGMDNIEIEYVAQQYASFQENAYIVLVWPIARGYQEEIESILSRNGTIVYSKQVKLSMNGMINLQRRVYKNEKWLGNYENDFEGVWVKASQCYDEDGALRVFLFESKNDLVKIKDEIRAIFNIGKHSVHINDTHDETIEISNLLFNKNSLNYLNSSRRKEYVNYFKLLSKYESEISRYDVGDFVIIGGVMSEYGIREAKDLDYITSVDDFPDKLSNEIEKETKKIKYTDYSLQELIYNPRYFFQIGNLKYTAPQVIRQIKEKRNNDSDKEDLVYLNKIINSQSINVSIGDIIKQCLSLAFYRKRLKMILLKFRYVIYNLLYGSNRKS